MQFIFIDQIKYKEYETFMKDSYWQQAFSIGTQTCYKCSSWSVWIGDKRSNVALCEGRWWAKVKLSQDSFKQKRSTHRPCVVFCDK